MGDDLLQWQRFHAPLQELDRCVELRGWIRPAAQDVHVLHAYYVGVYLYARAATMLPAPAILADAIASNPMGPTPCTTTLLPGPYPSL